MSKFVRWARAKSLWSFPINTTAYPLKDWMENPHINLAPHQSDLLIFSGSLSAKFAPHLRSIYEKMASPKWVIALGSGAISGAPFRGPTTCTSVSHVLPIHLVIPEFPPHPETFARNLDFLRELIKDESATAPADPWPSQAQLPEEDYENIGPWLPDAYTPLKFKLSLEGERIIRADAQCGFTHRGIEKSCETKTWKQIGALAYHIDELNGHQTASAFYLAIEKLAGIEVPPRAQFLRVIANEFNRMKTHLTGLLHFLKQVGDQHFSSKILELNSEIMEYEKRFSGHLYSKNYCIFGGVKLDVTPGLYDELLDFCDSFSQKVKRCESFLSKNLSWVKQTRNRGIITKEEALDYGLSGPNLRASGIHWDLRKHQPYFAYNELDFDPILGTVGDSFDRYWVAIQEVLQSLDLIRQSLKKLPYGPIVTTNLPDLDTVTLRNCSLYQAVESSYGEWGLFLTTNGSHKPERFRIRTPGFPLLCLVGDKLKEKNRSETLEFFASFNLRPESIDR